MSGDTITVFYGGKVYTSDSTTTDIEQVMEYLRRGDFQMAVNCMNSALLVEKYLQEYSYGNLTFDSDKNAVYFKGTRVPSALETRLIEFARKKYPIIPFVRFLNNLKKNPSARAVQELYSFLETNKLPITDDGCFVAYKRVRSDYKDVFSGSLDNSIGQTVTVDRNRVDDDKTRTCSFGLHFASLEYLKSYSGDRLMALKINPADVVSIPVDYNNSKGRCCKYTVIDELDISEVVDKDHDILSEDAFWNSDEYKDDINNWLDEIANLDEMV